MSKFLIEVSRGHAIVLSLLIILTGLALSASTPCRAENLLATYQFASNIQLAAPLPNEMKVEDVKIQNTLRLSYITFNNEDSSIQENISQGKLTWQANNLAVQSANIIDDMGDSITPLNFNGSVMNPSIEVMMKPYSMYNLSLIMVLMPGASYVDSLQAWEFGTTLSSAVPVQATITLPSNFSTPFYTVGAEYTKNQNYKVLTWQSQPQQTPNETIGVVFMPFPYNPETISLNFSTDISSVFPILGGTTDTETQEFTSLSEYNGLTVPQIFELPVLFPPTSSNDTRVVSVHDAEGPCTKLPEPLSEVNYTNCGTYYPDYKNQKVLVYPRAKPTENLYDYVVSVTFDLGKLIPFNATFRLLPPYDCIVRSTVNLKPSGDWEVNLTQESIVEFWLPQGTQPYENPNYSIYYDSAKGRYSVRFVNATSEWTTGIGEIDFYVVRLCDFFWTGIVSIALLLVVVVVMAALRKRPLGKRPLRNIARKIISKNILPLFTGFAPIVAELAIANDWIWAIFTQKIVLTAVLVAQVVLTIVVIGLAQKWKFGNTN
jgi:hypothetical protein